MPQLRPTVLPRVEAQLVEVDSQDQRDEQSVESSGDGGCLTLEPAEFVRPVQGLFEPDVFCLSGKGDEWDPWFSEKVELQRSSFRADQSSKMVTGGMAVRK